MCRQDREYYNKMEKPVIYSKGNLYDSIIREIDKIADYVHINQYILKMDNDRESLSDSSKEMFRFLMIRYEEIINDCMISSFISIHWAFKRYYNLILTKIDGISEEKNIKISENAFEYLSELIKNITKEVKMRIILKDDKRELNSTLFKNLADYIEDLFEKEEFNDLEEITISDFKLLLDKTYEDILNFLMLMKMEMERSTSVYYNGVIMKNMFYVALFASLTFEKINM
jgi:hypothetical protein